MIAYTSNAFERYSTRVYLPGYFEIMIVKYENKRVRNTNFFINYRSHLKKMFVDLLKIFIYLSVGIILYGLAGR